MTGQTIGKYEIVRVLGSGAMGVVSEARDPVINRMVAIKSLHPQMTKDRVVLDRLMAEANILGSLHHPNIPLLYDLLSEGGQWHMVMELVRGQTLETVLSRLHRLPIDESLAIIAQATAGLDYAHAHDIVHRDIKPSNLMIAESGVLKIMDFGIARARGSKRLTREGSIIGTLAYMSPEQIKGGGDDPRTDTYSLGCVLYEMLSGDIPFTADSEYDLIRAQVEQRPPPLADRVPNLPPRVESALMQALAKDPHERFATILGFKEALGSPTLSENEIGARLRKLLPPVRRPAPAETQLIGLTTTGMPPATRALPQATRASGSALPPTSRDYSAPSTSGVGNWLPKALVAGFALVIAGGLAAYFGLYGLPGAAPTKSDATALSTPEVAPAAARAQPALPQSSMTLPSPSRPRVPDDSGPTVASAPIIEKPSALPSEMPVYKGGISSWVDSSTILVKDDSRTPPFKSYKLFGIVSLSGASSEGNTGREKLKVFLEQNGRNVSCYQRQEGTLQCFANNQDLALWAVSNHLAKAVGDAPSEYWAAGR